MVIVEHRKEMANSDSLSSVTTSTNDGPEALLLLACKTKDSRITSSTTTKHPTRQGTSVITDRSARMRMPEQQQHQQRSSTSFLVDCDTTTTTITTTPATKQPSKRPWSLLSSPISSSSSSSPHQNTQLKRQDVTRHHPSPITEWPQRSPIQTEHDQDVSSFALLDQSLDTLSEADRILRPTPEKRNDDDNDDDNDDQPPPRKICVGREGIADISPIKLERMNEQHPPMMGGMSSQNSRQRPSLSGPRRNGVRYLRSSSVEPIPFAPKPYPSYHHDSYPQSDFHYQDSPKQQQQQQQQQQPSVYNEKGYSTTASNPIFVLRSVSKAFDSFTYRLSCLDEGIICPINVGIHSTTLRRYPSPTNGNRNDTTEMEFHDLDKARVRVQTAVCAFGGYDTTGSGSHPSSYSGHLWNRKSYDEDYYEENYPRRYTVTTDQIYWELETNPLIVDPDVIEERQWRQSNFRRPTGSTFQRDEHHGEWFPTHSSTGMSTEIHSVVPVDCHQKMRYRCKLCNQLKQNHVCPYRNFLNRSIGVTVHPSMNAYEAAEPGILAPSLSEMNSSCVTMENFVVEGLSPGHSRWTTTPRISPGDATTHTRLLHYSPESSLSTDSGHRHHHVVAQPIQSRPQAHGITMDRNDNPLFVETMDLKPEQFRLVSLSQGVSGSTAYTYPSIPLPFEQRKRLSDTLFALAREVPRFSEECAKVLRSARGNNEWDLGVAQLLCQVVVSLYCAEGDYCLDGLKDYLLRMGISC